MGSKAIKFIISVFGLTALCVGAEIVWNSQMPPHMHITNAYLMLGIFAAITLAIHLFLLKSSAGDPKAFVRAFMTTTTLKFFVYMALLIGFIMFSTENKQSIAIHFLFYYAVFTVLEVSMLYGEINRAKQ